MLYYGVKRDALGRKRVHRYGTRGAYDRSGCHCATAADTCVREAKRQVRTLRLKGDALQKFWRKGVKVNG